MTNEDIRLEIEKLTAGNRRTRWVGGVLIICLAIVVSFVLVRAQTRSAVVATEFRLQDQSGAVVAKLTNTGEGPCLELTTKDNVAQVVLCAERANGSVLDLRADHGASRAILSPGSYVSGVGRVAPVMTVSSKDDFVSATLGQEPKLEIKHGTNSVVLSAQQGQSAIEFRNGDQK